MDVGIVALFIGLIFLGHLTKARLLNVGAVIILMSQIFTVENNIIRVGLIFVVLYELYFTFYDKS